MYDGPDDWYIHKAYVLGQKTMRMKVFDVDTKTGPRAILRVNSHCAS